MSAFICSPKHIAVVAAYLARHDRHAQTYTVEHYADVLARENVKSVAYRYEDHYAKAVSLGTDVLDACAVEFCAAESMEGYVLAVVAEAMTLSANSVPALHVLKLAQSLDYQSCEHPDYPASEARKMIERCKSEAIHHLPGYDAAPWTLD